MQQGKQTIVTLENETLKTTRDFEVSHAERLLKMPNNGGWQLPENSKFEFDKENGLRYKRNKKQITEPRNKAAISRAIYHQNRIRFHAEKALTPYITQPVTDFLAYVSNLIPADKFKVFKTLFRYPVDKRGNGRLF